MTAALITDDIAFVGGAPVSVHCLISDSGLALIDTGFPGMLSGISENMRAVGLDLRDVKYIIHTHGHIDHYGCTADIVDISGAQTLIGREDADIVTGKLNLSWADELDMDAAREFQPDILFGDGDILELCGRKIRFARAPGHTEGTYALFIETRVNGEIMIAAMHGGAGLNSLTREFLTSRGLRLSLRDDFRRGLRALAGERVDIVLGNHPDQNSTREKLARLGGAANPFVDAGEWRGFLSKRERSLDEMLSSEK